MTAIVGTNSYVTAAEGDTYFSVRYGADAWTGASTADKDASLVSARDQLDRQTWQGEQTVDPPTQPLAWPRTGVVDRYEDEVDSATVPDDIKEGQMELALSFLQNAATQTATSTGSNIKKVDADGALVEWFRPTSGTRFPSTVDELVGQYLDGGASAGILVPYVSGTDGESSFEDLDEYGLTEGYP